MNPVSLFHPAVADWFDRSFAAPTAAQAQAWPAFQAGRHVLIAAPDRIRQDARGLPRGHRRAGAPGARARAQGRNPDRLRLAAQGAVERHQVQPRSAARRHPRGAAGAGLARRRYPHLGAHRRHARRRARPHAPSSAAYRGDHAGIALHPARLGIGPRHARDHPDRDRRRDPRIGAQQARHPSGGLARAPGGAVRQPAAARRPLRHAEADRGGRAFSGRSGFGQRRRRRLHHRRYRPPPRARSRARGSGRSARSRDVGRGVGAGLSASRAPDRGASHHADLRQYPPDGGAGDAPAVGPDRRRARGRAPRQPGQGAAPRRRAAAQARQAQGAGGDRLARARHRHRRGRPGLPARLAALDRGVPAAGRAIRPRGRGHAQGPAVPALARRAGGMRGAHRQRRPRRARPARHSRSSRSTCWRSRSWPRWRRRNGARTSCSR